MALSVLYVTTVPVVDMMRIATFRSCESGFSQCVKVRVHNIVDAQEL